MIAVVETYEASSIFAYWKLSNGTEPNVKILAATDLSMRSHRALRRAGLLARANNAELVLVHVVDDDQPADLVTIETREVEKILDEQIRVVPELQGITCRPVVLSGDPFDGILRAARKADANLIVMGAHRKQFLRDIFIGTTIERVVRIGPYPVLMVNGEVTDVYATAIAAVDMSDFSAEAIKTTLSMHLVANTHVTVVHGFDPWAKGKMSIANLPQETIDQYVATERGRAFDELDSFLKDKGFDGQPWPRRVEEGGPFEVISRAVKSMKPELLIMGTHGRAGIAKLLLGSVTEEALRSLDVDILAVPPATVTPR